MQDIVHVVSTQLKEVAGPSDETSGPNLEETVLRLHEQLQYLQLHTRAAAEMELSQGGERPPNHHRAL